MDRARFPTACRYSIRSADYYYLTAHRTWTAVAERRALMDFQEALRGIEEARKWNPSAIIIIEEVRA